MWVKDAYEDDGNGNKVYGTDKALAEAVKYGIKMIDKSVEDIFSYASALKGFKRYQRWGLLRGMGKRKRRKSPLLGQRICPDGGRDIVRDSRPIRDGKIHEYL